MIDNNIFYCSCYIRKNNIILRSQLNDLGYKYSGFDDLNGDCIVTSPILSTYSIIKEPLLNTDNPHCSWGIGRIDCEHNKDAFLALAALNINSDYHQWFILTERYGEDDFGYLEKGSWHLCKETDRIRYFPPGFKCSKATVVDILKQFNLYNDNNDIYKKFT